MKKIINNKIGFIIDIVMNSIILVAGYILLLFSDVSTNHQVLLYVYTVLYVLSFFSLIAYALNKKGKKFYYLLMSLLCVIIATFMMEKYGDTKFMLFNSVFSCIVAIFTTLIFVSDIIELRFYNKKTIYYKIPITFINFAVGITLSIVIYNKVFLSLFIMSYYFIVIGLLKLIESIMNIILDNSSLQKGKDIKTTGRRKLKELKKRKPRSKTKK